MKGIKFEEVKINNIVIEINKVIKRDFGNCNLDNYIKFFFDLLLDNQMKFFCELVLDQVIIFITCSRGVKCFLYIYLLII